MGDRILGIVLVAVGGALIGGGLTAIAMGKMQIRQENDDSKVIDVTPEPTNA